MSREPAMVPRDLRIPLEDGASTTAIVYHAGHLPQAPGAALILAHGAGANQRSGFMVDFASALAARGLDVITFNFLYTEQQRRIPDRGPVLEACYRATVEI